LEDGQAIGRLLTGHLDQGFVALVLQVSACLVLEKNLHTGGLIKVASDVRRCVLIVAGL
jgi:hypothetical protein